MDKTMIEAGVAVAVCLYVIQKMFELIKYLFNKKEVNNKEVVKNFECHAEGKEVTQIKMTQMNEQHEKMIENLTGINTSLTLMNDTMKSTNGKAARIEKQVDSIRQSLN